MLHILRKGIYHGLFVCLNVVVPALTHIFQRNKNNVYFDILHGYHENVNVFDDKTLFRLCKWKLE